MGISTRVVCTRFLEPFRGVFVPDYLFLCLPHPGTMGDMERKELRAPRYIPWLLGPVATGLGLLAHLLSGGALPWPPVLLALAALLSMCASLVSRLRLPAWALLLLCGLAQQVLHPAFVLFSGVPAGPQSPPHAHVLLLPPLPGTAAEPAGHLQELMLVTHVAAALLTALVMAGASGRFPRRPARDDGRAAPDDGGVRESAPDPRH